MPPAAESTSGSAHTPVSVDSSALLAWCLVVEPDVQLVEVSPWPQGFAAVCNVFVRLLAAWEGAIRLSVVC